MPAGPELFAFKSNVETTKANLRTVKSGLETILGFVDDTSDLIKYVTRTETVSNAVYNVSDYAVSIINLLEKMGPLGTTAKAIRTVLDGGPLEMTPNVKDAADSIRRLIWEINGDEDKNENNRIDPIEVNPDGEEGTRLSTLKNALNLVKLDIFTRILAVDSSLDYLDGVSDTTNKFIDAIAVATEPGTSWAADFAPLRDALDAHVAPANVAMMAVNDTYTTVVGSLTDLLDIFELADIDLSIDVNLDFGVLDKVMAILEEPLRIAASAIEPIEPYLDAVGAAIDAIVTPVVNFLVDTLELDTFLDAISDRIEALLPDLSVLENFEAQVNALIAQLNDFAANAFAEVDAFVDKVDLAFEYLGDAAAQVGDTPVWGDVALGPVGIGNGLNEIMVGGSDDEIFDPRGGADIINAGGGNDIILASAGTDVINGGAGTDMLYIDANFGEFELFRDVQNGPIRIIHIKPGLNGIDFGSEEIGTDVEILAFKNVVFDNIQDAIIGGSTLLGDVNFDGQGNLLPDDLLILNTSGTTVNGYHVADGLTGDDAIYGTAQADHLIGGSGNDLLVGQDGDDLIDGGSGSDTFLQLEGRNEDIKIDLGNGAGTAQGSASDFGSDEDDDTLLNIENYISEGDSSGDQRFVFGDANDNTLKTNGGDDIIVGDAGDDIIDGGNADNLLIGGTGSDRVFGGDNRDVIVGGGVLAGDVDVYDGGGGSDVLTFETDPSNIPNDVSPPTVAPNILAQALGTIVANGPVRIDAATGGIEHFDAVGNVIATATASNFENYVGSDANDTIFGFDAGGTITGADGDDILHVRRSSTVEGGAGDDQIILTRESSGGTIDGGAGFDRLDISDFDDVRITLDPVSNGSRDLALRMYSNTIDVDFEQNTPSTVSPRILTVNVTGIDSFTLGAFDDFIFTNITLDSNSYTIDTGAGNDKVLHDIGYLDLETGTGSDRIIADAAADVSSGDDDDYIEFIRDGDASFTRSIDAGSGNDTIVLTNFGLTTTAATVTGGAGFDTLAFKDLRTGASINVDLLSGAVFDQGGGTSTHINATATSVERVIGSIGADTLSGSDLGDQLIGREGADQITGRAGDDILYGGDAADTLTGGDGADFLHGGLGNDVLDGGTNTNPNAVESDTASYATGYRNTLLGELVADVFGGVTVDLAAGTASGAFGNDTLVGIENIHGSNNDDYLQGDADANYIAGGLGGDFMAGRAGDDFFSLKGNDWAEGGAGNDTFFVAGAGDMSVNGGAGHDVLDYTAITGGLTLYLGQAPFSGALDVPLPVWADLGTSEARHVIEGDPTSDTLTPSEVFRADPANALAAADLVTVPDTEAFEIELTAQSQPFTSHMTGIEEVIGTADKDLFIELDGGNTWAAGAIDVLQLNHGKETGQYAEVTGFTAMPTGSLTLEMLYRSTQPLDPNGPDLIFASYAVGSLDGGNSILIFGLPDSTIGIRFNNTEYYLTPIATSVLTDGDMHRLSVSYDTGADEIILYIDGTAVFTGDTQSLAGIPSGGTLLFGQEQDNENTTSDFNAGQILPGDIADIRLWNDVRTAQEIAGNAFAPVANPAAETSLVANWQPDATAGTMPDLANPGGGTDLVLRSVVGSPLPDFGSFEPDATTTLRGRGGSDTYQISDQNTVVVELADEGYDRVDTDLASYVLTDHVERLAFTDSGDHVGQGNSADNVIIGNDGRDALAGRGGDDTISGGADSDTLYGQNGADGLNGNTGDDRLLGGAGDDTLNGGVGFDTASYAGATGAVAVYLQYSGIDVGGGEGSDTFVSIENLTGSAFDDRLIGDTGANVLTGGAGADILKGKGGNDTFEGGDGDDILFGSDGDDVMHGGAGSDIMFALAGLDALDGGADRDFLYGGRDADIAHGGSGDDEVRGNLGNDQLFGDAGSDDLRGGGSNDMLDGGTGDDFLFGEGGADTLFGGSGNDALSGGAGMGALDGLRDVFVYADAASGGGGFDRIKDWEDGIDAIDLSAFGFATFGDVSALASAASGGVRVDFGGGDVLFIEDLLLANFDAGDILLT